MNSTKPVLSNAEIDAIGEILNISMGSAATAISTMLDKQAIITTPKVTVKKFKDISYKSLEPAMLVKIEYISGLIGSNVMMFRQSDMQVILNLLMGNDSEPSEDFEFDELSISAACEVMNQMMGASATALSTFLGKNINISTPTASVADIKELFQEAVGVNSEDDIVAVGFELTIENVMKGEFISIMTIELTKSIVAQLMEEEHPAAPQAAVPAQSAALPQSSEPAQPQNAMPPQAAPQAPEMQQPQYNEQPAYPYNQYPQYPPYQQGYGMYPPYGYPPMQQMPYGQQSPAYAQGVLKQPVNVQNAQFPNFENTPGHILGTPLTSASMDLVMNVPLNVSVEIGKTKKKIKDIMDFSQGTVIELEKQAGAPVDIVVNGQLIARGDVVVIDDNFGVRITEIVGTNELINSLDANTK